MESYFDFSTQKQNANRPFGAKLPLRSKTTVNGATVKLISLPPNQGGEPPPLQLMRSWQRPPWVIEPLPIEPIKHVHKPSSTTTHHRWDIPWLKPNVEGLSTLSAQQRILKDEVEQQTAIINRLTKELNTVRAKLITTNKRLATTVSSVMLNNVHEHDQNVEAKQKMSDHPSTTQVHGTLADIREEVESDAKTAEGARVEVKCQKLQKDLEMQRSQNKSLNQKYQSEQHRTELVLLRYTALEERLKELEAAEEEAERRALASYETTFAQNLDLQQKLSLTQGTVLTQKVALEQHEAKAAAAKRYAENQRSDIEKQVQQLTAVVERLKAEHLAELSDIKTELDKAKKQEGSLRQTTVDLKKNLQLQDSTHAQLEIINRQLVEAQTETLKAKEGLRVEHQHRKEAEEAARREIDQREATVRDTDHEKKKLTREINELETKMTELRQSKESRVSDLEVQLQELRQKKDSAEDRSSAKDTHSQKVTEELNAKIGELTSNSKKMKEINSKLEAELASVRETVKESVAKSEGASSILEQKVSQWRTQFETLKKKFDDLQEHTAIQTEDNARLVKEKNVLQKEKDSEVERLRSELKIAAQGEVDRTHLERTLNEQNALASELATSKKEYGNLVNIRKKEAQERANEKETREARIKTLEGEIERLRSSGDSVSNQEIQQLKEEMESLRSRLQKYDDAEIEAEDKSWYSKLGASMLMRAGPKPPEDVEGAYEEIQIKFKKAATTITSQVGKEGLRGDSMLLSGFFFQKKEIERLTNEIEALKQDKGGSWLTQLNPLRPTSPSELEVKLNVQHFSSDAQREQQLQAKLDEATLSLEHAMELQKLWQAPVEEALLKEGYVYEEDKADVGESAISERYNMTKHRLETLKVLYTKLHSQLSSGVTEAAKGKAIEAERLKEVESQLGNVTRDRDVLTKKLGDTLQEKDMLKRKVEDGVKTDALWRSAQQQLEELLTESELMRKTNDEYAAEILALKDQCDELQRAVGEHAAEEEELEPQLAALKSEKAQLQRDAQKFNSQLAEMKKTNEKAQNRLEQQTEEMKQLRNDKEAIAEENQRLQTAFEKLRDDISSGRETSETESAVLQQRLEAAQVRTAEAEKQMLEAKKDAERALDQLRQDMVSELKTTKTGIAALQLKLEQAERRVTRSENDLADSRAEAKQSASQMKLASERALDLENKLEQSEKLAKTLNEKMNLNREIEKKRETLEKELHEARDRLQQAEDQRKELVTKWETEKAESVKAGVLQAELEAKIKTLKKDNEKMKHRLDSIAEKVKQKKEKKDSEKKTRLEEPEPESKQKGKKKRRGSTEIGEDISVRSGSEISSLPELEEAQTPNKEDEAQPATGWLGLGVPAASSSGVLSALGLGGGEGEVTTAPSTDETTFFTTFGFGSSAQEDEKQAEEKTGSEWLPGWGWGGG